MITIIFLFCIISVLELIFAIIGFISACFWAVIEGSFKGLVEGLTGGKYSG